MTVDITVGVDQEFITIRVCTCHMAPLPPSCQYNVHVGNQLASFPGPHAKCRSGPGDTWQNSRMC